MTRTSNFCIEFFIRSTEIMLSNHNKQNAQIINNRLKIDCRRNFYQRYFNNNHINTPYPSSFIPRIFYVISIKFLLQLKSYFNLWLRTNSKIIVSFSSYFFFIL